MSLNPRLLAVFAPVALATVAFAQDTPPARQALSPQETLTQAREFNTKIADTLSKVSRLSSEAQKKKDAIKLNCVNDKLVQIRGHVAITEQTMTALNEAMARGNEGERQHEFTRMTILYQKVTVLGTEAENCVGEEPSYTGDTKVDVDIDPNIDNDDPTEPHLPLPDVTRPPEASPFN
jgi:hypothetical protein